MKYLKDFNFYKRYNILALMFLKEIERMKYTFPIFISNNHKSTFGIL